MKIYMKPIEMIAWFTEAGKPHPIRYRYREDHQYQMVRVDRVLQRSEEKLAGNRTIIYRCQSLIQGAEKIYELKYEISTCRWYLYKI